MSARADAGLTPGQIDRRCAGFVNACLVTFLVVFELVFYFAYVAPHVELNNIQRTARTVSRDLVTEYAYLFDEYVTAPPEKCAALVSHVRTSAPDLGDEDDDNTTIVVGAAVACLMFVVGLFAYWRIRIRPHVEFPAALLARSVAPICIAFVVYDFVYFTLFVERWDTISGDEFLQEVIRASQTPPPSRRDT
jgi:hypothetical protein